MFYSTDALDAQAQFSKYSLFECCYVGNVKESTYAVTMTRVGDKYEGMNKIDYFKTVDMLTGEVIRTGHSLHYLEDYALIKALDAHYSAEFVQHDGIILSVEFAQTLPENRTHMHSNAIFGQSVHYQDVDELHVKDTDGTEHCFS